MKSLLYILLAVYPTFSFLLSKDDLLINRIWGLSIFLVLFLVFLKDINRDKKYFNVFYKMAFLLGLTMLISIIVNQKTDWLDYYTISKYTLAFFIAGVFSNQHFNSRLFKRLFRLNRIYLVVFSFVIFIRLLTFSFNFKEIIMNRDDIWFGRPVFFAFFYSVFALTLLLESVLYSKYKRLKYLVFIPPLFLGARSVLIGFVVIFLLVTLSEITKSNIKKVYRLSIFIFGIITLFLVSNVSKLYDKGSLFFQLVASESDANRGSDYDVNTFSSGRLSILEHYVYNFEFEDIFFGLGGLDSDYGIGLHNDFLDLFFQYGIFTFLVFTYLYLFKIVLPLLRFKTLNKIKIYIFAMMLFYLIQSFFNPFIPTLTSIYFFILIIITYKSLEKIRYA